LDARRTVPPKKKKQALQYGATLKLPPYTIAEVEEEILDLDESEEGEEPGRTLKNPDLRGVTNIYRGIQKIRIAAGNRVDSVQRGASQGDIVWFTAWEERLKFMEVEVQGDMARFLTGNPAWVWMSTVKGVGPTLACKIIAGIDDIGRFDTISKLWSFAGYGLHPNEDGTLVIQRLHKGETSTFNQKLKTALYLLAASFLKSRSKYSEIYYNAVEHYKVTHAEWTPKHRQNAAMRKMSKIFLACLWIAWRQEEKLAIREPWIIGKGEHTRFYKPEEFSEKPPAK
jgi:hypothetical protein